MSALLNTLIPILLAVTCFVALMRIGIYCLMVPDKLVIIFFGIPIMLRYETIASVRIRGLVEILGADSLATPTWILVSRFWGPKVWIETNEGLVRRFVISPRDTETFAQELWSRVDETVQALEATQNPTADQAPSATSAK